MPSLPRARTRVSEQPGSLASGTDIVCALAPVPENADFQPRLFSSTSALLDLHGYSEGAEFVAAHFEDTGLPVYFVGLPIGTAGVVSRRNTAGNTGSSVVSVAGDSLSEHKGVVKVVTGGTVGTDQIALDVSLDGGRVYTRVRLGTGNAYTLPYVGPALAFGAGTLVAGDTVITWEASGPRIDSADLAEARAALAAELQLFRDMILIGDVTTAEEATALLTQVNAYETSDDRFTLARCNVYDRQPVREIAQHSIRMVPGALTFETTGDTVTRAAGSWLADGLAVGDVVVFTGTASNNATHTIEALTADVITVVGNLVDEVSSAGAVVVSHVGLAFDDSSETVTRSRGSWLDDGFRVGDVVTTDGTSGGTNDFAAAVTVATALVLTFASGTVDADEVAAVDGDVTVTAGQAKADWMTEITDEFEAITDAPRISLAAGKRACLNPITGAYLRRPPSWGAAWRSYQHDLHVTTWRKRDGILSRFASDDPEDWDDRVDGEAGSAARFTTFRSWANGSRGTYLAVDCTRATEGQLRVHVANTNVVNLVQAICQVEGENVVGATLELNDDLTATETSLRAFAEDPINARLERELLTNLRGEGKRASAVRWTASREDKYNQAENTMHGTASVTLGGIVFNVDTSVVIRQ
jgi:hypothetical protein